MRKIPGFLKDHAADAVTIAGTVGFGTVFAVLGDARRMLVEHTAASLLLIAAAFCLGASISRISCETGSWARRRKRRRLLADAFLCMPRQRKEMVAKAIDDGEVIVWPMDQDVQALLQLGILGAPAVVPVTGSASFSVQPGVAREIVNHRSEWLGM